MSTQRPPYLIGAQVLADRVENPSEFPFSVPALRELDLRLRAPVTFFVGENGTGKTTLIEALAALSGFPVSGGGWNERDEALGPKDASRFALALRPAFVQRPKNGYFFRAEFHAHFASLLEEREADPDFTGDPYMLYGGRSLHTRSHGEAFLTLFEHRLGPGLFLMDEPEAALSPQRQLALLALMSARVRGGGVQFLIATHSPILLTFPGAEILSFDEGRIHRVALEDTSHYQITRGILEHPQRYWRYLEEDDGSEDG